MAMLFKIILLLVVMATMAFASPADVNIFNLIATQPPIQVHCKLGNIVDVLPERTVEYNHYVGFGFKPNIWGTTRYTCDFKWGARTQSFAVWVDDFFLSIWRKRPCLHCVWIVSEDGFFREEAGSGYQTQVHLWK